MPSMPSVLTIAEKKELLQVFRPLRRGKAVDGTHIDFALVASKAHRRGREFARTLAKGEAKAQLKLNNRRFRG